MPASPLPVHSAPEILGGTPVFRGTRVPFQTLRDYLEAGDPLGEFLEDLPSVSRERAVAALDAARDLGWTGPRNGDLLRLMLGAGFEVFVTVDRNLEYQQNVAAAAAGTVTRVTA